MILTGDRLDSVRLGEEFFHTQTGADGTLVSLASVRDASRACEGRAENVPERIWHARLVWPTRRGSERLLGHATARPKETGGQQPGGVSG